VPAHDLARDIFVAKRRSVLAPEKDRNWDSESGQGHNQNHQEHDGNFLEQTQ
jgi:hypothetical protein